MLNVNKAVNWVSSTWDLSITYLQLFCEYESIKNLNFIVKMLIPWEYNKLNWNLILGIWPGLCYYFKSQTILMSTHTWKPLT